ncbi:MAG TPA: HIT domain-containing protein [Ignavibacteriaceae bacterium]|nr:HIT domain-containing protein [Ignavibacteriaceae bacterium]
MEKLWSPWRSQYIESFQEKTKKSGCIFCDAVSQMVEDETSLVVEKGITTFTVLNLYPYNNGHLMVVPNRHTSSFNSLTKEEKLEIMDKLQLAVEALKIVSNPDGFNIGANLGKVSGAGIDDHIHFHIVPRWNGDTNFMPVIGEIKVLSQDLLKTKKSLIQAYEKLKQNLPGK